MPSNTDTNRYVVVCNADGSNVKLLSKSIIDMIRDVGDTGALNTTSKSIVGAINEVKNQVGGLTFSVDSDGILNVTYDDGN